MTYIADNIPLWSVTIWDKNFSGVDKDWQKKTIKYKYLLSDELDRLNKGGDVRLLYTGKEIGFTTEVLAGDALCEGEIVAIPWGGTPSVKYYKGKFVTGDNRIATSSRPDELLNKYLYYLMKGRLSEIASYYRGAGLKHPAMKDVLRMNISYPAAPEQLKIITQFELLEKAIEHRQQQLAVLDDLIKARFVEMFGDPGANPRGWKKSQLKDHATVLVGYPFPSEGYTDEGIDIVGGYNLMQGYIQWEDSKHWQSHNGFEQYLLKENDIVMAMDRPWVNGGFKIAKVDGEHLPALLIQRTACIRSIDIDQTFLYNMLDSNRFAEHCNITGSLVPHISNKDINSFEIILPPEEEQARFATFVAQVDKSKSVIQKSLDETQLLFDSLMQKYFG